VSVTLAACLGATQLVLDVRTDLACTKSSEWQGVAISVGQPGIDVESRAPVLTTTACDATGEVGTLVIVPTGTNTAEVGIKVVAGITRNPEECSAASYDPHVLAAPVAIRRRRADERLSRERVRRVPYVHQRVVHRHGFGDDAGRRRQRHPVGPGGALRRRRHDVPRQ
jgi:hypothetical protein